jgi:small neutral amino acid transporter SnatA (MarC family)
MNRALDSVLEFPGGLLIASAVIVAMFSITGRVLRWLGTTNRAVQIGVFVGVLVMYLSLAVVAENMGPQWAMVCLLAWLVWRVEQRRWEERQR